MSDKIIEKSIANVMKPRYKRYAHSVISDRALPDIRSGLKPVQSRGLYSMNEMGLKSNSKPKKSARVVGDVLGKYHPHGDSACYEALVRMAQEWNIRYPLIKLDGNNGSRDGDPAAAMRYTEIKMTKIGEQMLKDIHKDTVEFKANYDDTELEPVELPCMLPMLLANGVEGIAVGMSTSIPPHNLSELLDASMHCIDNAIQEKETTVKDLMTHIKGPDFPDGGIIVCKKDLKKAYTTGKGKVVLRGKSETSEIKKGQKVITITQFPYQVKPNDFIKKVNSLIADNKIEGIREIVDESSEENGVKVELFLKKDVDDVLILNQLYKKTDLQKNINFNMTALLEGKPVVVTLEDYIDQYLNHCLNIMTRRIQYDLNKDLKRAMIIEAIDIAANNLEDLINIQKESNDTIKDLMEAFEFNKEQAEYIDNIKLKTLTNSESISKLQQEYEQLEKDINNAKEILDDEKKALSQLKCELMELKETYGDERRTTFDLTANNEISEEDLIKEEQLVVSMTSEGLIKAVEEKEYIIQKRGGKGSKVSNTKEDEVVTDIFSISSKDDLLFMTNIGRCHKLKGYKIPKTSKNAKGKHINNFVNLVENEYIVSVMSLNVQKEQDNSILFVTAKGRIKRLAIKDLSSKFPATKVLTIKENDELATCLKVKENDDVLLCTAKGQSTRITISTEIAKPIKCQGRTGSGVKGINVAQNDFVIGATLINDNVNILTLTANGLAKQTSGDNWKTKGRDTKGSACHKITEKTGDLVFVLAVNEDDEIFVGTDFGQIIRLKASSIATSGRMSVGSKAISLSEGDFANAASLAPNSLDDDIEDIE